MKRKAAMTPGQLRTILKRNDVSQVKAAQRLGIHLRTLTRWISGQTTISQANALLVTMKIGQ